MLAHNLAGGGLMQIGPTGGVTSANLDHSVTGQQAGVDSRPEAFYGGEQGRRAAVAQAYPDKLHAADWFLCEMKKVFILGDEDHLSLGGISADLGVGDLGKPQVENVTAVEATGLEKPRQGGGKLVIDEESHSRCKTGWSDRWAAYSMAARISSRTRKG